MVEAKEDYHPVEWLLYRRRSAEQGERAAVLFPPPPDIGKRMAAERRVLCNPVFLADEAVPQIIPDAAKNLKLELPAVPVGQQLRAINQDLIMGRNRKAVAVPEQVCHQLGIAVAKSIGMGIVSGIGALDQADPAVPAQDLLHILPGPLLVCLKGDAEITVFFRQCQIQRNGIGDVTRSLHVDPYCGIDFCGAVEELVEICSAVGRADFKTDLGQLQADISLEMFPVDLLQNFQMQADGILDIGLVGKVLADTIQEGAGLLPVGGPGGSDGGFDRLAGNPSVS